jgi:hypothetical protein
VACHSGGSSLTKSEYATVRDRFTHALQAVREVQEEFVFLAFDHGEPEHDYEIPGVLDDAGSWLTGDEYRSINDAETLLERLVGRAHSRSV